MNKKFLFIVALYVPLCQVICALEPLKMKLDIPKVLELLEQRNKDVSVAKQNVLVSQQGERVANANKLPDLSASLSVSYLGDLTIMDRDFSNAMKVDMPHLSNGLEVSFYQPLYMGGAIMAGVKLAESQTSLSQNALEITRQSIGMHAIGCFLDLFKAYNLREVYNENVAMTTKLLDDMKARRDEGIVLKNDITRYELRLSSLNYDLLTINNRIEVLNHDLCILLGVSEETEIVADIDGELSELPSLDGMKYWYDKAMDNASSLKAIDIQQDMNKLQRKLLISEQLPHIGLVAYNKLAGPIDFEVPVIDNNYNLYFFGVNVKYSFSSLFKTNKSLAKNKFEGSRMIMERQAEEENLKRAIDNIYTQYTQSFSMLETERKNVELATENYRIVEKRYNNQLALLTDMLDASTAKLDAEVRLVNARVNIIYNYYKLKYTSSTL